MNRFRKVLINQTAPARGAIGRYQRPTGALPVAPRSAPTAEGMDGADGFPVREKG